jgi:signal peptidase
VIEKHTAGDSLRFETKGDANEDPDPEPVYRSEYVGTVMFSIPFIGYLVAFGNTRLGYIALVLLPVMLLIFSELWVLYREGMREDVNYE